VFFCLLELYHIKLLYCIISYNQILSLYNILFGILCKPTVIWIVLHSANKIYHSKYCIGWIVHQKWDEMLCYLKIPTVTISYCSKSVICRLCNSNKGVVECFNLVVRCCKYSSECLQKLVFSDLLYGFWRAAGEWRLFVLLSEYCAEVLCSTKFYVLWHLWNYNSAVWLIRPQFRKALCCTADVYLFIYLFIYFKIYFTTWSPSSLGRSPWNSAV